MAEASSFATQKIANPSQSEGFIQQETVISTVSLVAWMALSVLGFSFATLVIMGALPTNSLWLYSFSVTSGFLLGCSALFNALFCSTSPPPAKLDPSSPKKQRSSSDPLTYTDSEDSHEVGSTGSKISRSSFSSASADPLEHFSTIEDTWAYDTEGKLTEHHLIKHHHIKEAYERSLTTGKPIPGILDIFKLTCKTIDVCGDGCCGYYAFAALLMEKSIRDASFKAKILARIKAFTDAFPEEEISFTNKEGNVVRTDSMKKLGNDVYQIFSEIAPNTSLEQLFSKERGLQCNLFFRAVVLQSLHEIPDCNSAYMSPSISPSVIVQSLEETSNPDNRSPFSLYPIPNTLEYLIVDKDAVGELCGIYQTQYSQMNQESHVILSALFNVKIGMIYFSERNAQGPAFTNIPSEKSPDGYLLFHEKPITELTDHPEDHYLACVARESV